MHYGITRRIHVILDEWRVAMVRENQNQAVFDHVANALCLRARRETCGVPLIVFAEWAELLAVQPVI